MPFVNNSQDKTNDCGPWKNISPNPSVDGSIERRSPAPVRFGSLVLNPKEALPAEEDDMEEQLRSFRQSASVKRSTRSSG